jgi:Tfp pilus assembly protein PilP
MRALGRSVSWVGLALVLGACGGPAAPPAPPKAATPAVTAPSPGTVAAATAATALAPSAPKYEAGGRRDPFESLESRLGSDRSSVTTAKLTGVIHSGGIALALVETPDGIGYILKTGDTLADGRLLEIGPRAAVFSIAPKPGTTINRVVLKLASD